MKRVLLFFTIIISFNHLFAQQYSWNGNASPNNCHCYTLTPNINTQSGSVWNNIKIDLNQSFDFKFDVYLGCADAEGADGIAFVLQPISTSIGSTGGGLGVEGIKPSVAITLDTWQNQENNDPSYDHIDIQYNGVISHNSSPPQISANASNVEDCKWHTLQVKWDVATKTYQAFFDGVLRISTVNDLVNTIFGGNALVYWGFTGSTGGSRNLQQFCTSLTPVFNFLPTQKRCINEPIQFFDATQSFGPVIKRYWDFGDGSPVDSVNINPVHTYTVAGDYTVIIRVIGADGCEEKLQRIIRIGSFPVAGFSWNDACADNLVSFTDISSVEVGTINQWNWDLGQGITATTKNPAKTYSAPSGTGYTVPVKLSVVTAEGCASVTEENEVKIYSRPVGDFTQSGACGGDQFFFTDASHFAQEPSPYNGNINAWQWDFGGGLTSTDQNPAVTLNPGFNTTAVLQVTSDKGCKSVPVTQPLNVLPSPVAFFKYAPICESIPATFTDSSYITGNNSINKWWWDLGNGSFSGMQNPSVTYPAFGTVKIRLAVEADNGCISDTLEKLISIGAIPVANYEYTGPVCENTNIHFKDLSVTATGTIQNWQWDFSGGNSSLLQNPSHAFPAGNNSVTLTVMNNGGCKSNAFSQILAVNPKPPVAAVFADACNNTPVLFAGNSGPGIVINQWQWNFGDNTIASLKEPVHTYANSGSYQVQLYAIDAIGCSSDTVKKLINIYGTNAFAGNDINATFDQPVQLNATGGISYQWSPATGLNNASIANPVAVLSTDQTYTLTASTPEGCETTDAITIKIYKGPEIYVPKAFTPDGNGNNDILRAIPAGTIAFRNFSVYNRFGELVFTTSDYTRGWDGRYKGEAQHTGAYTWMATAIDYKGNKLFRKGSVLLLR